LAKVSRVRARAAWSWCLLAGLACRSEAPEFDETPPVASVHDDEIVAVSQALRPGPISEPKLLPSPLASDSADAAAPPVITVDELMPEIPLDACPATMVHVAGGEYWMGSARGRGAADERPRFLTRVADFCLDRYEVTAELYARCVESGQCSVPHGSRSTCNYGRREQHPVNCVDWSQARDYCTSQGGRLPSELEWEYAARGGDEYQPFSWGAEPPDGRSCWKGKHSCEVGSFAAGAYGLHDMSGNVWEWTNDWFSDYPWPKPTGKSKVLRGGGWSHRFGKWLRTTLRNRTDPEFWGSHLGFRCARNAKNAECPFGLGEEPGVCRRGVVEVECKNPRKQFNGQRCALPGSPECPAWQEPVPGYGCVKKPHARPRARESQASAPDEALSRARSPEYDEDCRRNQPRRPDAYLLKGGTHSARNRYGKELGCKNRDAGVGWNSTCCP